MISKPLLGTDNNKKKLSWPEYIWFSCILQGWHNCWYSYKNWADLMGNNYTSYGIFPEYDDLKCCIEYFWDSLEDDILPKEFFDYLMQLSDDVRTGKVETFPLTQDLFDEIIDLVDCDTSKTVHEPQDET